MKSLLLVLLLVVACGSESPTGSRQTASFDLPGFALQSGQEKTVCIPVERPAFASIDRVAWQISGNVHHAALQAQRSPEAVNPGACPAIADTIHVWISGGDETLELESVALVLPDAPLFVEAHLFGPTNLAAPGTVAIRSATW